MLSNSFLLKRFVSNHYPQYSERDIDVAVAHLVNIHKSGIDLSAHGESTMVGGLLDNFDLSNFMLQHPSFQDGAAEAISSRLYYQTQSLADKSIEAVIALYAEALDGVSLKVGMGGQHLREVLEIVAYELVITKTLQAQRGKIASVSAVSSRLQQFTASSIPPREMEVLERMFEENYIVHAADLPAVDAILVKAETFRGHAVEVLRHNESTAPLPDASALGGLKDGYVETMVTAANGGSGSRAASIKAELEERQRIAAECGIDLGQFAAPVPALVQIQKGRKLETYGGYQACLGLTIDESLDYNQLAHLSLNEELPEDSKLYMDELDAKITAAGEALRREFSGQPVSAAEMPEAGSPEALMFQYVTEHDASKLHPEHWFRTGLFTEEDKVVNITQVPDLSVLSKAATLAVLLRSHVDASTLQVLSLDGLMDALLTLGVLGDGVGDMMRKAGLVETHFKENGTAAEAPLTNVFDASKFYPIDKAHWIYTMDVSGPPMLARTPMTNPARPALAKAILEGVRFALAIGTDHGTAEAFDPDRIAQNAVVGALGYSTADGLASTGSPRSLPTPDLFDWSVAAGIAKLPRPVVPDHITNALRALNMCAVPADEVMDKTKVVRLKDKVLANSLAGLGLVAMSVLTKTVGSKTAAKPTAKPVAAKPVVKKPAAKPAAKKPAVAKPAAANPRVKAK